MKTKMKMNKSTIFTTLLLGISLFLFLRPKQNNYVSHSKEPDVGDRVQNRNPSCKHFESVGTVTSIKSLKGDAGKTITYKVENDGATYCKGQLLNKTMDQLEPLK